MGGSHDTAARIIGREAVTVSDDGTARVQRAHRPLRFRIRSILFLLPAWFGPSSSFRAGFHRLRGARVAQSAEIGYLVMIDNLYPEKVVIEDGATVAAQTTILSHDESLAYTGRGPERVAETRIKRGAFVGVHCVILPGITVGERALVAAGSVVASDVEPGSVVAGVPARPVRQEDRASTMIAGKEMR